MATKKPTAGRPKRTFTTPADPRPGRPRPALPNPALPPRSSKPNPARAGRTNRSMNALDKAISEGKTLPSKNKKYPGDSDVGMKGFKKKPVIKIKKK